MEIEIGIWGWGSGYRDMKYEYRDKDIGIWGSGYGDWNGDMGISMGIGIYG